MDDRLFYQAWDIIIVETAMPRLCTQTDQIDSNFFTVGSIFLLSVWICLSLGNYKNVSIRGISLS